MVSLFGWKRNNFSSKKKEVFKYDKGMEEEKKYYATWHEDNFL